MHGVVIDGERLIAAPARRLACAPPVSVKPQTKKTTDDHTPCEATKPSSFHAAQRLRSTIRRSRRWRGQFRCRGSRRESAVAQLTSEVIRQRIFQDFFAGFLKGLLPNSTRSNKATKGLPFFLNAASQVVSS